MRLYRLGLPIAISVSSLVLFLLAMGGETHPVAAAPLSQGVITTTFDFDAGSEGWVNLLHAEWQASVECWPDVYLGTVCTGDFGLDPYQGVMRNDGGDDGSIYDADIYLPRMISADGVEFIVHRNTASFWSSSIYVYTRTSEAEPWSLLYVDTTPFEDIPGWPDERYQRVRLCFLAEGCPDWGIPIGHARHVPLNGSYEIRVKYGQVTDQPQNTGAFFDTISFVNCVGCLTGGWGTCSTVDNPDFDGPSAWTLQGMASIAGSLLTLPSGSTPSFAYQPMLANSTLYTVTVVAQVNITSTLTVGFSHDEPTLMNLSQASFVYTNIVPGEMQYELALPVSGNSGYLFILGGGEEINVDYICLEGSEDVSNCIPSTEVFDLNEGVNYNSGDDLYGYSQGWTGVNYFSDLAEGRYLASFTELKASGGYVLGWGLMAPIAAYDASVVAVAYDYDYIPSSITIDAIFPDYTDPWLEIWIDDGSGWRELTDETSRLNLLSDGVVESLGTLSFEIPLIGKWVYQGSYAVKKSVVTFDFVDEYTILNPVKIGMAIRDDSTGPVIWRVFGFNQIEVYGCPTGAPTATGSCVVADPDLDEDDGEPNIYYWQGSYTPDFSGRGGAIIGPGNIVFQSILPPTPGRYDLQVNYDVEYELGGCSFFVRLYDYNSRELLSDERVNCESGPGHQITLPMNLPLQPVQLHFQGESGVILIDRVCLTAEVADRRCLNQNPFFDNGITGYTGDIYPGGGYSTIPEGGRMGAIGVDYIRANPPYMLNLTVSPAISGTTSTVTINLGDIPPSDYDQIVTVTQQSVFTYSLAGPISGNFGPTLWANDGILRVQTYCITRSTTITGYVPPTDPFTCTTVNNSNFSSGLTDWNANTNVSAGNGVATFASGGIISQTLGSFDSSDAKIRWLIRAYAPHAATLWVASEAGVYSYTHLLYAGQGGFYEEETAISGTTTITVTSDPSGLDLDFICLYPGNTAPPLLPGDDPGTVVIPPGGELAECVPPPMGLLPGNITETLATVWPWGTQPTNFETMMAYNTGWVRYIGCTLDEYIAWFKDDFWGKPLWDEIARGRCILSPKGVSKCGLRGMLELILGVLIIGTLLNTLLETIQAIAAALDLIKEAVTTIADVVSSIGTAIGIIVAIVGIVFAILWMILSFVLTLFAKLYYAVGGSSCSAINIGTENYAILAGWQFAQDAIATTPLVWLTLIAANLLIYRFFMWVMGRFK